MTANSGFPQAPFVDPQTGDISSVWRFFLMALYNRTGAGIGIATQDVQSALATETTARTAALATLQAQVNAETGLIQAEAARARAAEALLAPLNSPALTGMPSAPTPTARTGSTQLATTAYVRNGSKVADNALAGQVGEFISANVASPGVTLTNTVIANVTSVLLTPGDWNVWGSVWLTIGTGGAVVVQGGTCTTSAAMPGDGSQGGRSILQLSIPASSVQVLALPTARFNLAVQTRVYLTAQAGFPSGTCQAYGYVGARRAR